MKTKLMGNQTADYITLKPIAERFKEIANNISDEEIKILIKEELRHQIKEQVEFGETIAEWVHEMLEDDSWKDLVEECMERCIKEKFAK